MPNKRQTIANNQHVSTHTSKADNVVYRTFNPVKYPHPIRSKAAPHVDLFVVLDSGSSRPRLVPLVMSAPNSPSLVETQYKGRFVAKQDLSPLFFGPLHVVLRPTHAELSILLTYERLLSLPIGLEVRTLPYAPPNSPL